MWRSSLTKPRLLARALLGIGVDLTPFRPAEQQIPLPRPWAQKKFFSAVPSPETSGEEVTLDEAKKLMRMVNVEAFKKKLELEREEVIGYAELLKECEGMGVVRSHEEAKAFAKVLDEAGVVLLFRDKVYLHPDKVVELVRRAVPLALTPEDDPRREELQQLQKGKEEIDKLAHKQVRRILWSGLGFFVFQVGLFFRLTFWEFSWDVMEPIAFFTTTTGLLVGYAYFVITSRDPTYQDFMERLFTSRQRKLCEKRNFNMERFLELQKHLKCPLDHHHIYALLKLGVHRIEDSFLLDQSSAYELQTETGK